MNAEGIRKAARRLNDARRHFERLKQIENGLDVPGFEEEWSDFLHAINSVPEILRTTARKAGGAHSGWFGRKDHIMSGDPLLMFLKHARGTDYHGLESGAGPHVTGARYLGYSYPAIEFHLEGDDGSRQVISGAAIELEGKVDSFTFEFKLTAVSNNRGTTFAPPRAHLGQSFEEISPSAAAALALAYYDGLLREAAARVPPSVT